jgi:hypothetical protein
MKALASNPRTISAIRKADALRINVPGGTMRKGTPNRGGSSAYAGPFAVVAATATSVTVYGNNSTEGRNYTATITLGTTIKTFPEATLSVTSSGYVYLKITYTTAYVVELATAASVPAQTDTEYYIPLAYVTVTDGSISGIDQFQYGQIQGSGRIF